MSRATRLGSSPHPLGAVIMGSVSAQTSRYNRGHLSDNPGIGEMIFTVTVNTELGERTYTGHVVCSGPRTVDMLLTAPHSMAGRTVHFPREAVVSGLEPPVGATATG